MNKFYYYFPFITIRLIVNKRVGVTFVVTVGVTFVVTFFHRVDLCVKWTVK